MSFICSTFSINSLKIIFKWSLSLTSGRFGWLFKGINVPFATPILILFENTFTTFKYCLFSRGYHVYKDVWIFIILEDSLNCEREEHNEKESRCHSMDDCVPKRVVGDVPLNLSKVASKFYSLEIIIFAWRWLERQSILCVGLGLEMPVNYFLWRCKSYAMGKLKNINSLQSERNYSSSRCHSFQSIFS